MFFIRTGLSCELRQDAFAVDHIIALRRFVVKGQRRLSGPQGSTAGRYEAVISFDRAYKYGRAV